MHPLSSFSFNEIKNIHFENYNLPFTPNDSALLWELLDSISDDYNSDKLLDDIDNCSPESFFSNIDKDRLLTLNESKEYEIFLKQKITTFCNDYPKFME